MERNIYVEDLEILKDLSINDSAYITERDCKELGLYFSESDMGDWFISRTEDCEVYINVY